jgi:hypothetical protein
MAWALVAGGGHRMLTWGWAKRGVGRGIGGKNSEEQSWSLGLSLILIGVVPFST